MEEEKEKRRALVLQKKNNIQRCKQWEVKTENYMQRKIQNKQISMQMKKSIAKIKVQKVNMFNIFDCWNCRNARRCNGAGALRKVH